MEEPHPLEEKLDALRQAMQDYVNTALAECCEEEHTARLVTGMVVVYETAGFDEEIGRDNYTINYVLPVPGQMSTAVGLLKIGSDIVSRDLVDQLGDE